VIECSALSVRGLGLLCDARHLGPEIPSSALLGRIGDKGEFQFKQESGSLHVRIVRGWRGFTLIELITAVAIMAILAGMAVPLASFEIKRKRERELRQALWEMRDAIDRYKDAADLGAFQIKLGTEGYPPDLQALVDGVDVAGKRRKFLRRIPVDPMTHSYEWGLRSMQDDPSSDSWGGQNVFDVHTKSQGTALDGTKYSDW
jgi:general secretion pathway protein G